CCLAEHNRAVVGCVPADSPPRPPCPWRRRSLSWEWASWRCAWSLSQRAGTRCASSTCPQTWSYAPARAARADNGRAAPLRDCHERGPTRPPHRGCLPRGGLDPDGQTVCPGGKQELSPSCRLKPCCLRLAEVKGTLQLRCLTWSLSAEEVQGRVGGDDGSCVSAEQIARILGCEDQAAIVFADASGQSNDEATHGGIVEKQAQLVNHEKPAPIAVLDPRPERFSQQIVDG